jgi:predicted lipoprotein with Yx(FWY)xxD motif
MRSRIGTIGLSLSALVAGTTSLGLVNAAHAADARSSTNVVLVATKTARFGTVLSATSGSITRTVYTLAPSKVACTFKCLQYWPEVLLAKGAKKASAGAGVNASKFGTVIRAGGRLQVTYAGKALYWFSKDASQGQVSGNVSDTWGKWTDVVLVKPTGSPTTTTTTAGGGGGIGF